MIKTLRELIEQLNNLPNDLLDKPVKIARIYHQTCHSGCCFEVYNSDIDHLEYNQIEVVIEPVD